MDMERSHPARVPAGTSSGGQFASTRRPESDLVIGADGPTDEELANATSDALQSFVDHADPDVRASVTACPAITDDQLSALLDPTTQPVTVRWAVALLPYPGISSVTARDPHPVIRAAALSAWDLDDELRAALEADEKVAHACAALAGAVR
jgi:hypothetical protein